MAAIEVPQTLEYRGGQLNAAPVLEMKNFTNWKKRFMCHIIGIEPQFKNIIKNGPFIPIVAGQRKSEGQWTTDERKDANLDQRLKSLIMHCSLMLCDLLTLTPLSLSFNSSLRLLLTISLDNHCLDNLDILKEDLEYQSLRKFLSLTLELS
ncbi:hypothetical protein Tco_0618437 [Tanacetum coccineum]